MKEKWTTIIECQLKRTFGRCESKLAISDFTE